MRHLAPATVVAIAALLLPIAATAQDASDFHGLRARSIGPANMSGRILDIAVNEANPYEFYAATAAAGIWKTTDNGVTWTPLFTNEAVHSVSVVTVDQRNPNVVWAGTGEATNRQSSSWGDGVYKSTDGGATWRNMGLRESRHVARIALDPRNSDVVYVAVPGNLWRSSPERGLYKSADGGGTWTQVLAVDAETGAVDVAVDPSNPNIVYAAMYQRRRQPFGFVGGGPGSGLYKSSDGGASWKRLSAGLPEGEVGRIGISIYRQDPRVVYVSVEQGLRYTSSVSYGQRLAGVYRSDDHGETWRYMSDWNPRPAYSSQIRVDPSDQSRIYMIAYSYSTDSGRTFVEPRQTLHGDDRVIWIDPKDSRHLIKGDDGGIGISYDRGAKWLYVTALPISQFYRIGVTTTTPYFVCGGLQDNGSWCGPNETYTTEGPRGEDWFRVGGGDGFHNVIDTTDNRTLYSSSQYLGLSRVDLRTLEAKAIRPTVREGEGPKLGNWGAPDPRVGRKIPPAGWNAPVVISSHDPRTLYVGMRELWKSTDRGESWTSLGDLTTGIDRRTLPIMGQLPRETTLSLDDGASYFPTITEFSESPRVRGLLYAGTDDGNVQVSRDDGRAWRNVAARVPGVPGGTWVSGLDASRHADGTVYVAFDGHQAGDHTNYLFRSTDFGETWGSIVGDLPPDRTIHVVREDPRNRDVLYVGTEFGFYFTLDGGAHWTALRNEMPTMPIQDFLIHPRENDLVLGSHGRGIWIVDDIAALQQLTPAVRAREAHLFPVGDATMTRRASIGAHAGDMIFRGENPPAGAIIDYWLRTDVGDSVSLVVQDGTGQTVAALTPTRRRGINRVSWDLRRFPLRAATRPVTEDDPSGGALLGRWVDPGRYTVRLTVGGTHITQVVEVQEDPRLDISPAQRAEWGGAVDRIAALYRESRAFADSARTDAEQLERQWTRPSSSQRARIAQARERAATAGELVARIVTLYGNVSRATSPPTADQRAQMTYFPTVLAELRGR